MKGVLADRFSLIQFKEWQLRAVTAAIAGEDVLVIQPTGSGKSLCFHFPALYSQKTATVITPTISLMCDQTAALQSKNLRATFLGTAQNNKSIHERVRAGEFELVLVSPESFSLIVGYPISCLHS